MTHLTELKSNNAIVSALLADAPAFTSGGWRAKFRGAMGSCGRLRWYARARLCVSATVVEGAALGLDFPYQRNTSRRFEVTGSRSSGQVSLEFHSEADFLRGTPFVCSGVIDRSETKIRGTFTLACFSGCGGGGGAGAFRLQHVRLAT